ncbi:universal stress protein [Pyrococcus horikoshii]|nr:universal stress protein [Pyrococcus horikoshii]
MVTILYPTDFSEVSKKALLECIPKIVSTFGEDSKLILLHVVDITMVNIEAPALMEVDKRDLDRLANFIREMGINVETVVRIGIPSLEISEVAKEENVNLIVIPSKGQNILRQMLLGSTASNLARITRKPVLILRYEVEDGKIKSLQECSNIFERPLVALDLSECSEKIIKNIRNLPEVKEAILFHVVDYGKVEELEANINNAKKALSEYGKLLPWKIKVEIQAGIASRGIIGAAINNVATLVVIGKKGKSILKELLLGSTAERVIRDCRLPTLLIPCD